MARRKQSASSINTFFQCPRKYYYQYILKLPTSPSIHLIRGSIVHTTLEKFFDIEVGDIEDMRLKLNTLFTDEWVLKKDELDMLDMDNKTKEFFFDESMVMINNWFNLTMNKIRAVQEEKKISFAEAFDIIKPEREQYFNSEALNVHGYIDAIEKRDGKVSIIDYKTSKRSEFTEAYKLQLGIYTLLYRERYNINPDKVGLFFLKDAEYLIKPDEEMIVTALSKIHEINRRTVSEDINDYPMKRSPLCKWSNGWSKGQCDFYEYCFEGKPLPSKEERNDL